MIVIDGNRVARYGWDGPPVRWEVKTAPCGCKYVGNAGLRDVQILERCNKHTRKRDRRP